MEYKVSRPKSPPEYIKADDFVIRDENLFFLKDRSGKQDVSTFAFAKGEWTKVELTKDY